jgi:hypothetical protein
MSTKTLLKRLALGTVVAVAAGTLSIVTTTSAHAGASSGYGSATTTEGGAISTITTSVGLLSPAITPGTTTTATATLSNTGTLVVTPTWASGHNGYYVVSAGGVVTTTQTSTLLVSGDQSTVLETGTASAFSVKPVGAAGTTFTVTGYDAIANYTLAAAGAAVTTPVSVLTVTITSSNVSGVPSVANSYVNWVASSDGGTSTADVANANGTTTGLPLYLYIHLRDAYKNDVTSTSGALVITATSGANAIVSGSSQVPTAAGTYGTAVSGAAPNLLYVNITEATAGAGWNGTVTVSYNGAVIATKSGTITGNVSKLTVTPIGVATKNGSAVNNSFSFQAYDGAGNIVAISTDAGLAMDSSSNTAAITGAASTKANSTSYAGIGSLTGGTTSGTSQVVMKYQLSNGTTVKSNAFTAANGGAAVSYTAKWDKSSYNQGDIAKLTVSFLDSKGSPASQGSTVGTNDIYALTTGTGSPWDATVTTAQVTPVSGAASVLYALVAHASTAAGDTPVLGAVKLDATGSIVLTFTIGSAATFAPGTYATNVDFPTVDARGGTAQVASLVINSTGGTSLNDVLKGIVSLIASINKQIAALAKLVAPAKKK